MLPPSEAEIVARDPDLPGLRLVLDAQALSSGMNLPPMAPLYLRYKPGTSCVAALAPKDGGLEALAVMAYTPARYSEVRNRREWCDGPDPAIFHDTACLALVPLHRDRALKGARTIADPERGPAFLRKLTGSAPGAPRLLRYKVGRRLVLRIGGPTQTALVKAYNTDDFAAALEGARIAEALGGAPLLGLSERRQCLAWRWLDGASLCPDADGSNPDPVAWHLAGQMLAQVHTASMEVKATLDRADEMAELAALTDALLPLSIEIARKAAPLIEAVITALGKTQFSPRLIHGDFSADQVLMHNGQATIIDWDRAAMGDPARDIGSFLARLDVQMLDGLPVAGLADAFCVGYAEKTGAATDSIALQHARALLALTTEGFRQRRPDWAERANLLLDRVAEILAEAAVKQRLSIDDPAMRDLRTAMNPEAMKQLLQKNLQCEIRHLEIDLQRHKPGRRALVRYRVDTDDAPLSLLGKLRAKGSDTRTPALHTQLRACGMTGDAPHYVGVPTARGVIATPPLWLQDEIPGCLLTTLLRPGTDTGPAARTGAALARLHAANVPASRQWTMTNELEILTRALATASTALPQHAPQIDDIAHAAADLIQKLEPVRTTGIHRDFYPDQVMIDGETVWLLDLDLYATGDPAIDVANFLAHLIEHGLRHHGDADALGTQGAAFIVGYDAVLPGMDRHRVNGLRFISLARHINISRIIAGRGHTTCALIDLCASLSRNDDG